MAGLSTAELLGGTAAAPTPGRSLDDLLGPRTLIDVSDPIKRKAEIRRAIGALPPEQRKRAMDEWARAYVEAERGESTGIDNAARGVARGSFLGGFLDEANAAGSHLLHTVTGGSAGAPYDEAVAYQRARDRDFDARHPVGSAALQIGGGLAGGIGALRAGPGALSTLAGGPLAAAGPAATWTGRMAQGAGMGAMAGAAHGAGNAEGDLGPRIEGAVRGAIPGAVLGAALPAAVDSVRGVSTAVRNVISPERAAAGRMVERIGDEGVDAFARRVVAGVDSPTMPGGATSPDAMRARALAILGEEMERASAGPALGRVSRAEAATLARLEQEIAASPMGRSATASPAQMARAQLDELGGLHRENPLMFGEMTSAAGTPSRITGVPGSSTQPLAVMPATGERAARDLARGHALPTDAEVRGVGMALPHQVNDLTDYLAHTGGRASATVRDAVSRRDMNNNLDVVERLRGLAPDSEANVLQRIEDVRRSASRDYSAAYAGPIKQEIIRFELPAVIHRHLTEAAQRAGRVNEVMQQAVREFFVAAPGQSGASSQTVRTLQQMQDARQAVRDMMEKARRDGDAGVVRALKPFYDDVTRLMTEASPAWRRANDRWADGAALERGMDIGRSLTSRVTEETRDRIIEFRRLAPEAQDLARVGFVQSLIERIGNMRDTHDVSKVFQTPAMREMVRTVMGSPFAIQLERIVRDQSIIARTRGSLGGSQTAQRLATKEAMSGDEAVAAAAQHMDFRSALRWLANQTVGRLVEGRNRELARMTTTPMSDVATIAQTLQTLRREEARRRAANTGGVSEGAFAAPGAVGGYLGGMTAPPDASVYFGAR